MARIIMAITMAREASILKKDQKKFMESKEFPPISVY